MGSRSRKRTRAATPPATPKPATPEPPAPRRPQPGPLDEFSAVAVPASVATEPEDAAPPGGTKPKRLRGEAANEAVRAGLKPLAAGERPRPLLVAIAVTLLLGAGNLVSYLLGFKVDGEKPPLTGVVSFASVMFIMAWGMWTKRYWAILGFQALLALIVVIFALFLPTASNWQAVLVCILVAGLGGFLFWKLVRVLARVQLPDRPGR